MMDDAASRSHRCPELAKTYLCISYYTHPDPGWHLLTTDSRTMYPITHCPCCGLKLETPPKPISITATREEWMDLLTYLTTTYVARPHASNAFELITRWRDRIHNAMNRP